MNNNKTTQIIIGVLVVLLIGASFAIGSMYTQLRVGGSTNTAVIPTQQAATPTGETATATLTRVASQVGLDETAFSACLSDNPHKQQVADNLSSGTAAGVRGTPGNILYNTRSQVAVLVPGAYPLDAMEQFIRIMEENPNLDSDALLVLMRASANEITPGMGDNLGIVPTVEPVSSRDHTRGNQNPTIALIEYSDFRCGFCARFHDTAKTIVANNSNVAWVYRHFPVLGPESQSLAEGSECAYELGGHEKFWEFSDALMTQ